MCGSRACERARARACVRGCIMKMGTESVTISVWTMCAWTIIRASLVITGSWGYVWYDIGVVVVVTPFLMVSHEVKTCLLHAVTYFVLTILQRTWAYSMARSSGHGLSGMSKIVLF